jgi:hypothetical protein
MSKAQDETYQGKMEHAEKLYHRVEFELQKSTLEMGATNSKFLNRIGLRFQSVKSALEPLNDCLVRDRKITVRIFSFHEQFGLYQLSMLKRLN